ncbi:hypothetical protein BU23DRAFT_602139 [Bimuria novae-zelandiae CBS 107.79]|uniref:Uncharacterized protein n=1 Tax=Bimuria novae-zelandiae CBS 107.79 TaxID=1447943 RepID=A0A6A5UUR2_9PLEO|nr:hypothetical protein BU23DRAFT_602139 [Bimuria novae-zelandiae CBS 107.79]
MSWKDSAAYKAYSALGERPRGLEPWGVNNAGEVVIGLGELFCRCNIADEGEEVELCRKPRFSHTGNLRSHVKTAHKMKVAEVRKGTSSGSEGIEAEKFYKAIIKKHDALGADYDPNSEIEQTPGPVTPSKPPKKIHRPLVPRKKDRTVNKSQMRKTAGIGKWCPACKEVKRTCPGPKGSNCKAWEAFTSESESESESGTKI